MTPEEFDIMIGGKRKEAMDYARTTSVAFQQVIDWATKQRNLVDDMARTIEAFSAKDQDDADDYA